MQFPYTLPPPARQSDLMSQVMSQMTAAAMVHQPTAPKRQRGEDDIEELPEPEDHQGQPDPAEKPRPCAFYLSQLFFHAKKNPTERVLVLDAKA